jgi:DNA-binding transcriptional ArsR family regulator
VRGEAKESALEQALKHPLRKRFIAALWHSSEPLTAARIEAEYLEDDGSDLGTIVYHLRVLEAAGVVRTAAPPAPGVVLGGENAGEAVRRLGIADGRDP